MASPLLEQDKQSRLKALIAKGKDQGYLTYAEVNDHLPEGIVDPTQIEDIINTINDMGIQVLEIAPEAESRVLTDASVSEADDETTEEAVAALASIESELGRTTDPVRMYMREMGSVELLTREGEIEIAKRIEEGLKQVLQALATNPNTVGNAIKVWEKVQAGESRLNELLVDFHKSDEELDALAAEALQRAAKEAEMAAAGKPVIKDAVVDTGPDIEKVKKIFSKIKRAHTRCQNVIEKKDSTSEDIAKARTGMAGAFLEFKYTPALVTRLTIDLHAIINRVRQLERHILSLAVNKAHMPRKIMITTFPQNEITPSGLISTARVMSILKN